MCFAGTDDFIIILISQIVAACRGIEDKADEKENCQTEKQKDKDESETAQHMSTEEFKLYDALLPEVDTVKCRYFV